MSISATCPGCNTSYQLTDSMSGKRVRCKSCSDVFVVRAKTVAADRDEDEEGIQANARPTKRVVRYEEDDDMERPQPRRRPRAKRGNTAIVPLLIVGGIVAVVLILILGGVAVWALMRSPQTLSAPVAVSSNPQANVPQPAPPPMVPPINPPGLPQMPAQGPLAAELKNANISGFGARMEVTADYRITSGNPTGRRLVLMIKPTKTIGLLQNFYLVELHNIAGRTEGKIHASGMTFGIENGPFEMWIGEGPPGFLKPMSAREIQRISNVVTVAFRQNTMPGMRPPFGPRGRQP